MCSFERKAFIANHHALVVLNNLGVALLQKRDLQSAKNTFADALHHIMFVLSSTGEEASARAISPDVNAQVKKAQSLVLHADSSSSIPERNSMPLETSVASVTHFLQGCSVGDQSLYQDNYGNSSCFSYFGVRISMDESFDYSSGETSMSVESAIVLYNTAITLLCMHPPSIPDAGVGQFRLRAGNLFQHAQHLLQYHVQNSTTLPSPDIETSIGIFYLEIAIVKGIISITTAGTVESCKSKERLGYLFETISMLKERRTACFGDTGKRLAEAA